MAHVIGTGADALYMNERDHVVTALREIRSGETISYRNAAGLQEVTTQNDIPFGHKIAVAAIEAGDDVRKYGEVIGRAVAPIVAGQHVHVHNIEGIRGRGDLGAKETN
ncbi:UxaA family hydrolase [Paenibacillus sacheonensis]|uniref:D-galactarate dehydratase n=1 Tax=Paenibacillus sacheonensis TaxID=742054 RepID=A0A7X4YNI7_9BACL|nr:UxaA family hydrolase [Paenibacillus sacheonensis]MBM7565494.1 altronate dehydratase small subunit [Paenibacillus sacheonensis]NBC69578.1 D-galactarate dehydratase [Paenibacillus sacheonensis]